MRPTSIHFLTEMQQDISVTSKLVNPLCSGFCSLLFLEKSYALDILHFFLYGLWRDCSMANWFHCCQSKGFCKATCNPSPGNLSLSLDSENVFSVLETCSFTIKYMWIYFFVLISLECLHPIYLFILWFHLVFLLSFFSVCINSQMWNLWRQDVYLQHFCWLLKDYIWSSVRFTVKLRWSTKIPHIPLPSTYTQIPSLSTFPTRAEHRLQLMNLHSYMATKFSWGFKLGVVSMVWEQVFTGTISHRVLTILKTLYSACSRLPPKLVTTGLSVYLQYFNLSVILLIINQFLHAFIYFLGNSQQLSWEYFPEEYMHIYLYQINPRGWTQKQWLPPRLAVCVHLGYIFLLLAALPFTSVQKSPRFQAQLRILTSGGKAGDFLYFFPAKKLIKTVILSRLW